MLDLDSLAAKRAQTLNQTEEAWRKVLWSPAFQALSQSMTDGEIEDLLSNCASSNHVESILYFIESHPQAPLSAPYATILTEAKRAGVDLRDWIQKLPGRKT